jgi:long-subunit acyl-CoA synthetase (AMP-forming)
MSTIEVRDQRAQGGHLPARSERNVAHAFLATVARHGDEVALRDPARGAELSWNQWRDRVAATAAGLAKLGVSKGDTVALVHSNRHEFYIGERCLRRDRAKPTPRGFYLRRWAGRRGRVRGRSGASG